MVSLSLFFFFCRFFSFLFSTSFGTLGFHFDIFCSRETNKIPYNLLVRARGYANTHAHTHKNDFNLVLLLQAFRQEVFFIFVVVVVVVVVSSPQCGCCLFRFFIVVSFFGDDDAEKKFFDVTTPPRFDESGGKKEQLL